MATVKPFKALMYDFKKAGCGYRSPYLVKAVRQLADLDVNNLSRLDDKNLVKELMRLSGIGPKVAGCLGLFSAILPNESRFRICPVDVHIGKAIEQLGEKADEIISHKYAGIAQQYIFYYLQHLRKEL